MNLWTVWNARKRSVLLLSLMVALAAMLAPQSAHADEMTFQVNGVERKALVFEPTSTTPGQKAPLVFAFHGLGGNMVAFSRTANVQLAWPQAIVVYMQGLPMKSRLRPNELLPGWQYEMGQDGDRDLKFFDAALATLRGKYPVDDTRIYSMGFSNGAFFSLLLWSVRPNIFAAFAIVAGELFPDVSIKGPKPVIHVAGEEDATVSYKAQQETIQKEIKINGASGKGTPCGPMCTLYPSKKNAPVETIIHSEGHIYPPFVTSQIVDFFSANTLGK